VGRNVHPFLCPSHCRDGRSLPGYPGNLFAVPELRSGCPGNLFAVPELRSGCPGKVLAVHDAASSKKIY